MGRRSAWVGALAFAFVLLARPPVALAHVERPAYWPNPAPDCSVAPCAGGRVPGARSSSQPTPGNVAPIPPAATFSAATAPRSASPSKRRAGCGPRSLTIRFRVPRGQRLRSVSVYLNGRRMRVLRGRRIGRRLTLRGLPTGRFSIKVVSVTARGQRLVSRRTFARCGAAPQRTRRLVAPRATSTTGLTRVVCQSDSLGRAQRAIADAQANGYVLRPSLGRQRISAAEAGSLLATNRRLFEACGFESVQEAVNQSHNNDRVVIMPGVYTEPNSRAQPTNDPRCAKYLQDTGGSGISYRYQFNCPNDQALVNVLGRGLGPQSDGLGPGAAPNPPRKDRHGIPDEGPCIRCNLQIEGSGVKPEDVAIDSGDPSAGNGGPSAVGSKKDVALKVDRADGIVLRNFTVRHSAEHSLYIIETDGYRMDRMKYFYAGEYGHLTFAADHGLTENCESAGSGDAGVYPGGAPDTGAQATSFYPDAPRYNQEITRCDVHHNVQGNSGSQGNAILLDNNDFYDNVLGINTDSLYPGGHPGYPQDSARFENNRVYSNNFNAYAAGSDVTPDVFGPVGTGILTTGGNDNQIVGNRVYDNWRRGTMLIGVPNIVSEQDGGAGVGSTGGVDDTSFRNLYTHNVMGIAPNGAQKPNGVDFWWDQFPGNTDNRWCDNQGVGGAPTSDPPSPLLPGCSGPSVGTGDPVKEAELVACGGPQVDSTIPQLPNCTWNQTPPRPGTSAAAAFASRQLRVTAGSPGGLRPGLGELGCVFDGSVRSGLAMLGCSSTRALVYSAGPSGTAPLQKTTCATWRRSGTGARMAIIHGLAHAATRPDPENFGPTLSEKRAYAVLSAGCAARYARGFLLYEIYNRAAAFQGRARLR